MTVRMAIHGFPGIIPIGKTNNTSLLKITEELLSEKFLNSKQVNSQKTQYFDYLI